MAHLYPCVPLPGSQHVQDTMRVRRAWPSLTKRLPLSTILYPRFHSAHLRPFRSFKCDPSSHTPTVQTIATNYPLCASTGASFAYIIAQRYLSTVLESLSITNYYLPSEETVCFFSFLLSNPCKRSIQSEQATVIV